jgi:drug/metabolite transporter (DMT)-like permease
MISLWLPLALFAYISIAGSSIIDKIIVGHKIKDPLVISFYVAIIGAFSVSILAVGLLPYKFANEFRFSLPNPSYLLIILSSGAFLQLGLLCSYAALKRDEATRVVYAIGAASPVFTLIFASLILHEKLKNIYYFAFALLLIGAVVISVRRHKAIGTSFGLAILSAFFLALQTVLAKLVYAHHSFISSFVLLSIGGVLYALLLLILFPRIRAEAKNMLPYRTNGAKKSKRKTKRTPIGWIFANSAIGSIGVLALNLAVKLGPASLVNALRGVQYAAIFIIALIFAKTFPQLLQEELSHQTIQQKLLGIAIIGGGIALLTQ